ncbi:HNH endonuclease signature motif containing protein [Nocardioides euryhalodurans]|uniref:HNH endonuclease n=1 Tax=Nocardioides euryhalodurans TaxID=2518370 RepID=A0A4P7GKB7_9ACTN|nr:HNH endonuclease signature motif containing protein [Nocardioides euryhalodurans]QBR92508.1 HNH endonuclease [Nocardioides euryhalodurans]
MFDRLATDPALAAARVLATATQERAAADRAEARLLVAACDWADLHPPESIHLAACFDAPPGSEREEQIAGQGCPLVAEFSLAELAAALGMSTTAGKRLVGHALELRHRLPRLWHRVQDGQVQAWRARRIAEATIHADLEPTAAAYVDRMVAPYAERIGVSAIDRLVAEALARCTTVTDATIDDENSCGHDPRHVTVHDPLAAYDTTVRVEAEVDLADALARGAEELRALGSTAPLDVRRSRALGHLARHQTALDLTTDQRADSDRDDPHTPAREVVLHVRLAAAVTTRGEVHLDRLAELEEGPRQVLLDQVRSWCAASHTRVTIRPVLDLAEQIRAPGYAIPPRLREQVVHRDRTCVFPWCSRPARRCQVDHVTPYDPERPDTSTGNLAALCTFHHRLKTHGGWSYTPLGPGEYLWRSPHGHHYLHDHTGTRPVDRPRPRP